MKPVSQDMSWMNLPNLPLSVKVLFSGYLLAIGLGLCMAGLQIMLTHGMADGKVGLSLDDIVYSYYGDRSGSHIESKLNGSMKEMGTPEARLAIIKWAREGAPEAEWEPRIKDIFGQHCVMCHSTTPNLADFTKLEEVKKLAKTSEGASIQTLTRVSHIHLFGISFIFFFVGFIFSFAVGIPKWLKISVIAFPFAFLILDIISWWATKWSPGFAWLTIIGGFGYSVASTIMWFVSMYQMTIMSRSGKVYGNVWEADSK